MKEANNYNTYIMIPVSKDQKAVRACTIRLVMKEANNYNTYIIQRKRREHE